MIKNTLYSSGQTVTLATGQSYTLKDNEVMINKVIYRKADTEITLENNSATSDSKDVKVGIRKRNGVSGMPAHYENYDKWYIDGTQQTTLAECVENINTAIYYEGSGGVSGNFKTINNETITGTGNLVLKSIIEVSGSLPVINDRIAGQWYELKNTNDVNIKNGLYWSDDIKDLTYLEINPNSVSIPTEVSSYADITNGDAGIYYLTQVDGTHQIGQYTKLADGSIVYQDDEQVQSDLIQTDNTQPDYVKNIDKAVTVNSSRNLQLSDRGVILFVTGGNYTLTLQDLGTPFGFNIDVDDNAQLTIDANGMTIMNLSDNLIVDAKKSAVCYRLDSGEWVFKK